MTHGLTPVTRLAASSSPVLSSPPNDLVVPIHNRMPVILLPEDEDHWLDPDMTEPEEMISLLRPYPAELITLSPV